MNYKFLKHKFFKSALLKTIRFYQSTGVSRGYCRFNPTCSEYTYQAISRFGIKKGLGLGWKRIIRCHPFGQWGDDPLKGD